jgi:threonine dehydrogenase-like Zn-dependent dehydrogenase
VWELAQTRVIVVGAGIGGLTSAALLAAQGCDVTVCDMASGPGGKARQDDVAGVGIDAGPTVFTKHDVFAGIFESCGGAFAWLVADALGPAVRGVALLDSALPRQATIEAAEPGRSRWVLFGQSAAQSLPKLAADRERLEDNGFPVGMLPEMLGETPPAADLCGWVEALGVL